MVHTSYLGNLKNIPDEIKKVSIMRYTPEWAGSYIDKVDLKLAPSKELFEERKSGKLTSAAYKKRYLEEIAGLDITKVAKKYKDTVLLCTCTLGHDCHRHILAEYMLNNDIPVVEIDKGANHKDLKLEYSSSKMKKGIVVTDDYFKLHLIPLGATTKSVGRMLWFKLQLLLRRIYRGDRVYITKTPIGTSASMLGIRMPTVAIAFGNLISNHILKYTKKGK